MSPLAAITALCTVLGLLAILRRPQYVLVLVLVMFPLEQLIQSYFPFFLYNRRVFNIAVAAITGMALLLRMSRSEPVAMGYRNMVVISVWGLYGLTWLSLLYSPSPDYALASLLEGVPYYVLMILVLPMLVSDIESFRRILFGLMVAGVTICVLIYINPATTYYGARLIIEFDPFAAERRGNPLATADLGGVISIVAILYRPQRAGLLMLALRVVVVIVGLGLAVASGSRGQVLVAVIASLLLFPISRGLANGRQIIGVGFGLLIMILAIRTVFNTFITDQNEGRWGMEAISSSVDDRLNLARSLLGWWLSTPAAWPMGLGVSAMNALDPNMNYVHNVLVEALCEEGLLGITLLGIAMWFTFDAGRKLLAMRGDDPLQRSAVATLAALALYNFLLHLKQGSFVGSPVMFVCWILLAKIHRTEQMLVDAAAEEEARPAEDDLVEEEAQTDLAEDQGADDDAMIAGSGLAANRGLEGMR